MEGWKSVGYGARAHFVLGDYSAIQLFLVLLWDEPRNLCTGGTGRIGGVGVLIGAAGSFVSARRVRYFAIIHSVCWLTVWCL